MVSLGSLKVRIGAVLLCGALTVHAQPAPAPSENDVEVAKAHYRTGELNYEAGRFADAAREFEEAYRLTTHGELLYNMGKCYDAVGDLRGALVAYRKFMATVPVSTDRPFVEKRTAELNEIIARLQITSSVDGSNVMLDGQHIGTTPLVPNLIEVNPGDHAVDIAAEGFGTFHDKVHVEKAQTGVVDAHMVSLVKVIRVEEKRKYVPVYKRWYLWTPIGIVVAAGVTAGVVLGVRAAEHIDGPQTTLPSILKVNP